MANEIISTFTTTPYVLDVNDTLYIAETGRILTNVTNAPGLSNRTSTDNNLNIMIDGSVISLSGSGISLTRPLASDNGSNTLIIGQSGLVRSLNSNAIYMNGRDNSIVTNGEIASTLNGIRIEGNSSEVSNSGIIQAGLNGIEMNGDFNRLVNTGDVTAPVPIYMRGNNLAMTNSGTLTGQLFGNVVGTAAAAVLDGYLTGEFTNSGQIMDPDSIAVSLAGASGSNLRFDNTGTISGREAGVRVTAAGDGSANLVNGGHISGGLYGMVLSQGDFFVNTTATGAITSAGTAALLCAAQINLTNSGIIAASGQTTVAVVLGSASAFSSLTNTGTISSTFAAAIDARAVQTGGSVFLTNFGSILGAYQGGAVGDQLANRGLMASVITGDGADNLRNRGLVSDFVILGNGNDAYDGRRGEVADWVDGGQNDDLLRGGLHEDDLRGGIGNDTLLGGDGDDKLQGSLGFDELSAGAGDDTLTGGGDQDQMAGGAGSDLFIFGSAAEAGMTATKDRISDFNLGNDTIDLSAFMAGGRFIGSAAFSSTGISEVRYLAASGLISGDVGGNGTVEWQVQLTNTPNLTAADFTF